MTIDSEIIDNAIIRLAPKNYTVESITEKLIEKVYSVINSIL